jgi:hypothetical protein
MNAQEMPKISKVDFALYAFLIIFCFFSFNHADLTYTIGCSTAYLSGHFKDFYDFNSQMTNTGNVNYLPSTYILFAIWGIPMKLLGWIEPLVFPTGFVFIWYKILTTFVFFGSAYVLSKISKLIGKSNLLPILFVTSPIAVYSAFLFGQYDILTVFLTLLGLLAYFENKFWKFSLFFSIAITFKYFPFFVYLPLLLLVEKRIVELVKHGVIFAFPLAIEVFCYRNSPEFKLGVLGFSAANRAMLTLFSFGSSDINLVFFVFFLVCFAAYLLPIVPKPASDPKKVILIGSSVSLFVFSSMVFHPQWALFIVPLLSLIILVSENIPQLLFLDFIGFIAFLGITFHKFAFNADQRLLAMGIWGPINPNLSIQDKSYLLQNLVPFRNLNGTMWTTLFDSVLVITFLQLFYFGRKNDATKYESSPNTVLQYLRLRFYGGLLLFILPAFYAYFRTLRN